MLTLGCTIQILILCHRLLGARLRTAAAKDDLQRSYRASRRKATLSERAALEFPHRWQTHQRGEGRSHSRGIAPALIPPYRHRTWQQTRATSLPLAVTSSARRAHLVEDLIAATLEPPRPSRPVPHLELTRLRQRWPVLGLQDHKGTRKSCILRASVRHFSVS